MKQTLTFLAILCLCATFAHGQVSGTIPSTSGSSCVKIGVGPKVSAIAITITGTWSGTLQPQVSLQGQAKANTQVTPTTSSTPQSTITGNGSFIAGGVAGFDTFLVCGNTVGSGTANIFLNYSTVGGSASAGGAAPVGTAGGDLSGAYPNPTVAQVNGATPGGTCTNQVVTALSSSAVPSCSSWQGSTATPLAATSSVPYTGMLFWFSADCIYVAADGTCGTPSNTTDVAVWQDRSGNYSYILETAAGCTFNTNQLNSLPGVTFNGTCGKYTLSSPFTIAWNGQGLTIFAVVKDTLTSGSGGLVSGSNATGDIEYRVNGTGKYQEVLVQNSSSLGTGTAAVDNTNFHIINVSCGSTTLGGASSANPVFTFDRAADATVTGASCGGFGTGTALINAVGWNRSGNNELFKGVLVELVAFRRVLNSTENTAWLTYLHNKYGI